MVLIPLLVSATEKCTSKAIVHFHTQFLTRKQAAKLNLKNEGVNIKHIHIMEKQQVAKHNVNKNEEVMEKYIMWMV